MSRHIHIHIEGDSYDILNDTSIHFITNKGLSSESLARALIEYTCDAYYDYATRNITPEYAKVINGRSDGVAEFMRIIMLSLSQERDPLYMADIVFKCVSGDDKQNHMKILTRIISNLAERHVIEVVTTSMTREETVIRWRSPYIPMTINMRHMYKEEEWKMWWQAYFCALKRYDSIEPPQMYTPHKPHTPHTPQINEEELLTFLAQ